MCGRGSRARSRDANANEQGIISLVSLSPQWEQAFAEALTGQGEDRHLSMAPSKLQEFIGAVRTNLRASRPCAAKRRCC